jgi:hypothetical protein
MKHIRKFNESNSENISLNGIDRSRDEVIDILFSTSDLGFKELKGMSDKELADLWKSLEVDDWLNELEED